MRSEDQQRDVYELVMRRLRPAVLPEPWNSYPSHDWFSGPVRDGQQFLQELLQEFPEDVLLESGVVKRSATGECVLNELLVQRMNFLMIRDKQSGSPAEIWSPLGPLNSSVRSILTAVDRENTVTLNDRVVCG